MSWIAAQAGSTLITPRDLPPLLRQVVSFVEAWPAVAPGSVSCYETTTSIRRHAICFQFDWDTPSQVRDLRIQSPEIIGLWFGDNPARQPPQVRSDREDFPRCLPHCHPICDSEPACFCLSREPIDGIYARRGIRGILERLNTWLRDAAAGNLDHDGWEPTPRWRDFGATLDIGAFQQFALRSKQDTSGVTQGFALAIIDETAHDEPQLQFRLVAKERLMDDLWDKAHVETLANKNRSVGVSRWFCVWGARNKPVASRFWLQVTDRDSLLRYADFAGCKSLVEAILVHHQKRANTGKHLSFLVLIGTWRPKPLIKSTPGLSDGPAANLELAGFYVWMEKDENLGYQVTLIAEARLLAEIDSRNLNEFAGYTTKPRNTVVIGLGALGAKVAEHLVREGAPALKLVDHDKFSPHNLARHTLAADSIFFHKVTELKARLGAINPHCQVQAYVENLVEVGADSLKKDITGNEAGALIDATADIQVLRRLCKEDCVMRVARIELAHKGLLGLLCYEGRGRKPRVDDLKALIPALGREVPAIASWLTTQETFTVDIGIGCASASMQMSDSRVAMHAANFMASLGRIVRLEDHAAGIGIAALAEDGHFAGWKWIAEEQFHVFSLNEGGALWEVRTRKSVLSMISNYCEQGAPTESGGYLYGTYDLAMRTVYVTAAVEVRPQNASPIRITLPAAGTSSEELELRKFSGDQLAVLGTWHTHPGGDTRPSSIDVAQFRRDAKTYALTPTPHVMLIHDGTDASINLAIPESWSENV